MSPTPLHVLFRPAVPTDAPAIVDLVRQAFGQPVAALGQAPWPVPANYGQAIRDDLVWLVLEQPGGGALAALHLQDRGDHMHVVYVAVRPDKQGLGLGRALLALAEDEALAQGYDELRFQLRDASASAIRRYQNLGYRPIHPASDVGGPVVMGKVLRSDQTVGFDDRRGTRMADPTAATRCLE